MSPSLKSKSSQMKSFKCQVCDQLTFFENLSCVRCQHDLGYIPEDHNLATLDQNASSCGNPLTDIQGDSHLKNVKIRSIGMRATG